MKLVRAEFLKFGTLRTWHHAEHGRIDTVTSWLERGAVIITVRPFHSKAGRQRRAALRELRMALGEVAEVIPLKLRKTG